MVPYYDEDPEQETKTERPSDPAGGMQKLHRLILKIR
jgi:hypothetical protein